MLNFREYFTQISDLIFIVGMLCTFRLFGLVPGLRQTREVSKKKLVQYLVLICLFPTLLATIGMTYLPLQAQELIQWSPQARIPEYEDLTEVPPFLVVDQNLTVHTFNSQPLDLTEDDSPRAVFYRQWSPEQGWSDPIDIILNPEGDSLNLLAVYLDSQDVVHMIIQMNLIELYYTRANLAVAGRANAWSTPLLLDDQSVTMTLGIPFVAAISGDEGGNLVVIYSGVRDGNGIYAMQSADGGISWSNALPIHLTGDDEILPVAPKLYMGDSNLMHAVWSSFNNDGSGGPGYYAQLDMRNGRWDKLVDLDVPGIRTPNVIEYEGDIIVTYYHHNENKNWWRKSSDGGQTWSDPILISSLHRGTNGFTSLVIDSENKLHLFFAQRIDDNNHGVWQTLWTGNSWTEIVPVVRGPQVSDQVGGQGFDPHSARAVVVNGNHLLVTWVTDGFAGLNGAWYAYAVLDSPEFPRVPLPTLTPFATITALAEEAVQVTVTPTPTRNILANGQLDPDIATNSPATPLIFGLIPAIALVIGVVIFHQIYYRPRN